MGATSYFNKEAAEFYQLVSVYLFSKCFLTDIRGHLAKIHSYCEKVGLEDHLNNRDIDKIRLKTIEDIKELLPNPYSRWDGDFDPLCTKGKGGWSTSSKILLMPNGYKELPLNAMAFAGAFENYDLRIPFMSSKSQIDEVKSIFGDELVTNVADNKRGLINKVYGKVEDSEADAEDVSLYKTKVIYFRNFQTLYKFVGDSTLHRMSFWDHNDSEKNCLHGISSKVSGKKGNIQRNNYSFPNVYNVDKEEQELRFLDTTSGKVSVQKGSSVIPGFDLEAYTDKVTYTEATKHNKVLFEAAYGAEVGFTTNRVDSSEWDIDHSKDAVIQLTPHALFKDRFMIPQNRRPVKEVSSFPAEETRYIAVWKSDTGHKEVVSGTSPKRALSNIRRRIRKDIVDSLNIF